MCCRFYIDKESPEMQKIIAQMNRSPLMQRWPSTQSETFAADAQISSLRADILSSPAPEAQLHGSMSPTALSILNVITPLDIHPMDLTPVIAPDRNGKTAIFPMQWGYNVRSRRNGRRKTDLSRRLDPPPLYHPRKWLLRVGAPKRPVVMGSDPVYPKRYKYSAGRLI